MNTTYPFFSVIIPLYNKEDYISRAVSSVLSQTYQNFEIIVINDGSTDQGLDTVQKISDPRISVITTKNRGASAARNLGIKCSQGEIIAFLDADDQWLPEYLLEITTLVNCFPEAKVYATAVYQNNGNRLTHRHIDKYYRKNWKGLLKPKDIFYRGVPFNSSSVSIDRSFVQSIDGFDEKMKYGEDINMWMRLSLLVPIAYSSKYLAEVFINTQNRSNYEIIDLPRYFLIEKSLKEAENSSANLTQFSTKTITEITKTQDDFRFIDFINEIGQKRPKQIRGGIFLSTTKISSFVKRLSQNSILSAFEKFTYMARLVVWIIDYSLNKNRKKEI